MNLLYRWIDSSKGWRPTTLKKEEKTIEAFYDIEEAKEKLRNREIILCGVKIIRLFNGVT